MSFEFLDLEDAVGGKDSDYSALGTSGYLTGGLGGGWDEKSLEEKGEGANCSAFERFDSRPSKFLEVHRL